MPSFIDATGCVGAVTAEPGAESTGVRRRRKSLATAARNSGQERKSYHCSAYSHPSPDTPNACR